MMKKLFALLLAFAMVFSLAACGHEHTWVEATCTEPKTCSTCGATEGEPLGHTWAEATLTTPKTCTVCGETEGDPLVVVPERPQIYDQDGFNVSYDETCIYLLALLRGDVAKYKMGMFDKMENVEFRADHVEHIDSEIAEQNAHRYLYVDGKYTGVFLYAHNDDSSVVTGASTFDQIGIGYDDNIESDAQSSSFLELSYALFYLCSASRSDRSESLDVIHILLKNPDTLVPIGKANPLAAILKSEPFELDIMELN